METKIKYPEKEYPYLAVYNSIPEDPGVIVLTPVAEIVLISLCSPTPDSDKMPYVQHLIGGKEGYFTKNEHEYLKLPSRTEVTIINP